MTGEPQPRKLIETGIPLSMINHESAREKSLRHGLPNTLHLYWSRKPLATTRTILFAQLVDDPASHPERFSTTEEQDAERRRLHELMERMAVWENRDDAELYREVEQAILESNGGRIPDVLDPFAGGGAIPLEAQRLGAHAHGSDLNPLAVIINKALIEFPSRFCGNESVHPDEDVRDRNRAGGLADDIRYYGRLLRDKTFAQVGHLYPKVKDDQGAEHTVIAWKWARTVTNPNPANPVPVPLVNSWWLSKKKGHEAWVKPIVNEDGSIRYEVQHNADGPTGDKEGTVNRRGAVSIVDGTPIDFSYIRAEGRAGRLGAQLIGVVADGGTGRLYCSPSASQEHIANVFHPTTVPQESLPEQALGFRVQAYGFEYWSDLFTNRQLTVLTTLADTVETVRQQVLDDALAAGMPLGAPLDDGGDGAQAYADAIAVYLALAVSRLTDHCSTIVGWNINREGLRNVFARQAIPMTWDFAEANPFSQSSGNFLSQVSWVAEAVENVPAKPLSEAHQADAATRDYTDVVVSTDPPYYDNIGYSDLSDYFYVWLRPMLSDILPSVTATMMTPKAQELVANPYRHGGKDGAARFFTDGFNQVFAHIRRTARTDVPMTVYYAYKQKDNESGTSTGWYALLDGLIKSGWEITATWPVRSERSGRMLSVGTNALASSIVLACRQRPDDAETITARIFNNLLRSELSQRLRTIIASEISPVDLSQAAIGPGISVYSRYARIRQPDGTDMSVNNALQLINQIIDEVMGEEDTGYDADTRFAVTWYQAYGWGHQDSGIADQLARTNGTSTGLLESGGILETAGGDAWLRQPQVMTEAWDPTTDVHTSLFEVAMRLTGIFDREGAEATEVAIAKVIGKGIALDSVRALVFRMFHEAEKRDDSACAQLFNALVSMWSELASRARVIAQTTRTQETVQGEL